MDCVLNRRRVSGKSEWRPQLLAFLLSLSLITLCCMRLHIFGGARSLLAMLCTIPTILHTWTHIYIYYTHGPTTHRPRTHVRACARANPLSPLPPQRRTAAAPHTTYAQSYLSFFLSRLLFVPLAMPVPVPVRGWGASALPCSNHITSPHAAPLVPVLPLHLLKKPRHIGQGRFPGEGPRRTASSSPRTPRSR